MNNQNYYSVINLLVLIFFASQMHGQKIEGKLVDSSTKESLAYVNIGVINSSRGTITDETGKFVLECDHLAEDAQIRFSMIGYKPKLVLVSELIGKNNKIALKKASYSIDEVVVEWKGETRKVGTHRVSNRGVCGWGGANFAKGHELGLRLELGSNTVKINDVNVKVHQQSYDTVLVRLHIRSLKNGIPDKELLNENIFINISKSRGWQSIALSKYNILVKGDVVLSLEWIRASNVISKRAIRVNGKDDATPKILFNIDNKKGTFYTRRGSEAQWKVTDGSSPGLYVSISE